MPTVTGDYWIGAWHADMRPADTFYCWQADPDYDSTGCVQNGFYAVIAVKASTASYCLRPTGFACPAITQFDWDSVTAGTKHTFNLRFHFVSPKWQSWDRDENGSNTMGSVCTSLGSYGNTCHSPAITFLQ